MKELRGKKALITGAASGIGRCLALALAREGTDLFLVDINKNGLDQVAREARAAGVEVRTARCDLMHPEEISRCLAEMLAHWGRLELLVNNAGVVYYGPTDRMTPREWDWLLQINLHAPVQIIRELLPTLLSQPQAHVLNVSSIAGLVAGPRLAAYHLSKFGLVGLTESLRAEYGRHGLGFTALCPGLVRTRLFEHAVSGLTDRQVPTPPRWLSVTPERVAKVAIRAIRRNRGLALVSPLAHVLWRVQRYIPGVLDYVQGYHRKSRQPAPEPPSNPGIRRAA